MDDSTARFIPKKGHPVDIDNVFKVTSGWRNQEYGEPIIPALDTYVEVLYGDPTRPSVAYFNDGRFAGLGVYFRTSRLREALRTLVPSSS